MGFGVKQNWAQILALPLNPLCSLSIAAAPQFVSTQVVGVGSSATGILRRLWCQPRLRPSEGSTGAVRSILRCLTHVILREGMAIGRRPQSLSTWVSSEHLCSRILVIWQPVDPIGGDLERARWKPPVVPFMI